MKRLQSVLKSLICVTLLTLFVGCATTASSPSGKADDMLITKQVNTALFQEPTLRTSKINIKTTNGVVQLTGFVEKALDVETAKTLAGAVPGVVQVKSDLAIKD